jgi:hypothetical protein
VDTINGFVTICPLGLLGFNGCGYAAVNEGYGIVSADHIKSIPKRIIIMRTAINQKYIEYGIKSM